LSIFQTVSRYLGIYYATLQSRQDSLLQHHEKSVSWKNFGKLRIAYTTQAFNEGMTHLDCVSAVEEVAKLCAKLGHQVEEAKLVVDAIRLRKAPIDGSTSHIELEY
jgi:Asp-tRNA(Asn)/Glu-tRNA(Gln) amidotransferase A subunit family amidase